ncbi:TetR/AcrR family transcriptional regulator [Mycolicibacterium hassiacum]|uniref:TetR/AcrR family transcriptional regulator n=1 Tax=Mycolicibacterium hassiacum TaxID=46351 RepID=UPI000302EDF6|nr:helix-turn-helix domain-containing protein [Mycolicibacterium hassiacum]MDA4088477.1 TetR family transcriptional regulator [Mycolicibacterium hassiacum DSM 44199]
MDSAQEPSKIAHLDVWRARRGQRDLPSAVLDATVELMARRSYHEITLQTVAQRCGTSLVALRQHFPSKDVLLARVYLRRLHRLPLEIDCDAPVVDRTMHQVRLIASLFADDPALGSACNIALMRNDDPAMVVFVWPARPPHRLRGDEPAPLGRIGRVLRESTDLENGHVNRSYPAGSTRCIGPARVSRRSIATACRWAPR